MGLLAPGGAAVTDAIEVLATGPSAAAGRQDNYALAAGRDTMAEPAGVIARGAASMTYSGVPGSVFDAAEDTVRWTIAVQDGQAVAVLSTLTLGRGTPDGVSIRLRNNEFRADGALDAQGRATLPLLGAASVPLTAAQAWDADWTGTTVIVGAEVDEPAEVRERIRRFARNRLAELRPDAFLAEILAAESDY